MFVQSSQPLHQFTTLVEVFFVFIMAATIINYSRCHADLVTMSFQSDRTSTVCIADGEVDDVCIVKVPSNSYRSLAECAHLCKEDGTCVGVSEEKNKMASSSEDQTCFKHHSCSARTGCSNPVAATQTEHVYYAKACGNGGDWDPGSESCQCIGGWVGPDCRIRPENCSNGGSWDSESLSCKCIDGWVGAGCRTRPDRCTKLTTALGYDEYDYHRTVLDPYGDGSVLIPVECYVGSNNGFRIGILYNGGNEEMNKTWSDFRNGFSIDEGPDWIGLEHWHALSEAGYNDLYLELYLPGFGALKWRYFNFQLEAESTKYRFRYDSSLDISGTDPEGANVTSLGVSLGVDCLYPSWDVPFSTWDQKDDVMGTGNCPSVVGSGWWFSSSCAYYAGDDQTCNLFGWTPYYWDGKPVAQRANLPGLNMTKIEHVDFSIMLYLK